MDGLKLIADSGATKTEWRLVGKGSFKSFFTVGLSPYHMNRVQIRETLLKAFPKSLLKKEIGSIHYYGTGCKTKANANIVKKALEDLFPDAAVHVTHDLMGAAIATSGNKPGIACILGTGSNSCTFNGKKILLNSPGLGYILGDEGSGAYLGRKVVQHFLYGTFDAPLMKSFKDHFKTDKNEILQKVYKEPFANRYLASFTVFLSMHRGHFIIENIIEDGLRDFFEQHLGSYPQRFTFPIHFVGSIAFYFKDKIAELCHDFGFKLGVVIKQPMDGLVAYHKKN
jgi:N-acetylglucosamine kinase-like BadF-type ATPase